MLLTVAPRDRFRVIIEVDERDIAWIKVAQQGSLALSALPWDTLPLKVIRITPMASPLEGATCLKSRPTWKASPTPFARACRGGPDFRGRGARVVGLDPSPRRVVAAQGPGACGAASVVNSVFSAQWYRVAGLHPRLRAHVRVTRQIYRNEVWHVLADPVSGHFHRINATAYAFVGRCDGRHSVDEISEALLAGDPDSALTQDEIVRLLVQLNQHGLIQCELTPDVESIFHREALVERQQRRRSTRWLSGSGWVIHGHSGALRSLAAHPLRAAHPGLVRGAHPDGSPDCGDEFAGSRCRSEPGWEHRAFS
jgi:hypothetical protein